MSAPRVRFAPSPTGFFHIGSARTALFNWLYARKTGGTFILRIEDTDKQRNTEEALRVLLDGMRWLGLDWDEGPEVGGDQGPYFQSQRGDIYRRHLDRLKEAGHTCERDGAIYFRLPGERHTVYDDFRKREVEKVKAEPFVVSDAIRGEVSRTVDEDFVLVRASGDPVFHFVNVVDDITMGVTHVIRGEDHLSNTHRHALLFDAFGVERPVFAHIPLILKQNGPGKMSKRDEGALIEEYAKRHFLPDAVRNYLALLGWNPKDDREKMGVQELIEAFSLEGINRDNARFDERKLTALNAEHLRDLPVETLTWLARPMLAEADLVGEDSDEDYLQAVVGLSRERIQTLGDLPDFLRFFYRDDYSVNEKALGKARKTPDLHEQCTRLQDAVATVDPWNAESIESALKQAAEKAGQKPFAYFPLARLAVSGQAGGPDLMELLALLGRNRVLARIERFANEAGTDSG